MGERSWTRRDVLGAAGTGAAGLAGCVGSRSTPAACPGAAGRSGASVPDGDPLVRFSSFPDFLNWDIPYPAPPGWADAIDWFLDRMKAEGPAFSLVAGDIMNARWWRSEAHVREQAARYWGGWRQWMDDHDITAYVAPGDHERGDNPWADTLLNRVHPFRLGSKLELVPTFEQQFREILDMPDNGPEHKRGLAYYLTRENALFVSVDTFEVRDGRARLSVSGAQLEWLREVLADHREREFVVVQGHVPVLPDVRSRGTSALVLEGGRDSAFWQTLVEYGVDAYLCGEHHALTVTRADGVWQVVHGALWGAVSPVNYLVGRVYPGALELVLKEFPLEYAGGRIHQPHVVKGPRAVVRIPDAVRRDGPDVACRLVIDSDDD